MMFKQLIAKIKLKNELKGLSDKFVESLLLEYLKKYKITEIKSEKAEKLIIKDIRAQLRRYTGQYQPKKSLRNSKLSDEDLLKSHISTRERLQYYSKLIEAIKEHPHKSILDLGCGLNPLIISKEFPKSKYFACDIKEDELLIINEFFKKNRISGKSFYCDLLKETPQNKVDLVLILKVFDLIDKKGHKNAERIINNLNFKNLIVSFSTKKLSGKSMNSPRRNWFEQLLKRLGLSYNLLRIPNEVFYIIKKP